jgi:hypothetical protein
MMRLKMRDRRIINMNFHGADAEIRAAIETNSLITLWSHLRFAHWSPPLIEPESSYVLWLGVPDREPIPPLTREFLEVAKALDLSARIKEHTAQWRPSPRNTAA